MTRLTFKPASASRSSSQWQDEDYDVLADGVVVDRIMKAAAVQVGARRGCGRWPSGTPTHGSHSTHEAAMAAFAKSWRRE
jgi:hypothetical protein